MRATIAFLLLLLHVSASAASPLPPAPARAGGGLVVQVGDQRRAPGTGGTQDHTSADSTPYGYTPVPAPNPLYPSNSPNSGYDGSQQYGCLDSRDGWPISGDGLGNQNYTGGSCTFRSPSAATAACPEGCGTYTYYPTKTYYIPGGGVSDGQQIISRSGCSPPVAYTGYQACDCGSYTDSDGNNQSYCNSCPYTYYACGGSM